MPCATASQRAMKNVPEDAGMAEIEQACALARQETADEWRSAGRLPPLAPAPKAATPRRRAAQPSGKTAKAKPARRASAS